ncbi:MAG: hypothetical protein ACUVTM_04825 [Candidatus Bathyarchaeia archaeon]
MVVNRNVALITIIVLAIVGSVYVANHMFTVVANTGPGNPTIGGWSCLDRLHFNKTDIKDPRSLLGNWSCPPHLRNWQGNVTVNITGVQAEAIVDGALKEFKVGAVSDRGVVWMVNINYKDKPVMAVPLGKVNTPTSQEALKAVQDSIGKGWTTGEPKQHGFIYNTPIIDANGNTVGNVRVDGRTGEILTGHPMMRR